MRYVSVSSVLVLVALVSAGCEGDKKVPPGCMAWSVRHDGALVAKTETDRDVRGVVYACVWLKDPFASPGEPIVAEQCSGATCSQSVDLNLPDSTVGGQDEGSPPPTAPVCGGERAAFQGLEDKKTYTLVLFLDDDNSNALKKCVDGQGKVQVNDRDPISVTQNILITTQQTTTVTARFDHRFEERIY